jgi:AcrR family transcriptional regulator
MTLGRPREFDRETALDAAMRLFWHKGFRDSSLEELLNVMKISKSSFYATFKSKESLFAEAISYYSDFIASEFSRRFLKASSGRLFLKEIFSLVVEETRNNEPRGCLIMNSAAEFGQQHAEFSHSIHNCITIFERLFQQAVLRGQSEGDISPATPAATLGAYLCSSLSGLHTMAKGGISPETIQAIIPSIFSQFMD